MSLANISIKRPTFLTCIIIIMLAVGWMSMRKLPVDLFPDINFPIVTVTTIYPGAGPNEIETNVSKVIEDEVSNISGIKTVRSVSREGASQVIVEFNSRQISNTPNSRSETAFQARSASFLQTSKNRLSAAFPLLISLWPRSP